MKSERNRNAEEALVGHEAHLSKTDQAAKTARMQQRTSAAKVDNSGLNSRVKGHVVVQTKRNQSKRDAKQG